MTAPLLELFLFLFGAWGESFPFLPPKGFIQDFEMGGLQKFALTPGWQEIVEK